MLKLVNLNKVLIEVNKYHLIGLKINLTLVRSSNFIFIYFKMMVIFKVKNTILNFLFTNQGPIPPFPPILKNWILKKKKCKYMQIYRVKC